MTIVFSEPSGNHELGIMLSELSVGGPVQRTGGAQRRAERR